MTPKIKEKFISAINVVVTFPIRDINIQLMTELIIEKNYL